MHRGRWTLSSFNITIFAVSTARDTASGSFDGDGYQERIHKKSESSERAEKRDTVALHLYFAGAFLLAMAATFGQMVFSMMFLPTIAPEIASYTFPMMAVGQVGHSFYAVHPFLYLLLYNLYDAVYLAGIATLALPLGWLTGNPFVSLIGPTAIFYFMGFFFDTFSASQWEPSCILPPYSDIYLSLPIMIIELCILLVISALLAMTCEVKKHDVF